MEQFSLEKYLENPQLYVVTRQGHPVRIICTDSPILHHPIVGFVECDLFTWTDDGKVIYGGKCEDKNDLFFADEEDELTEFEKEVKDLMNSCCNEIGEADITNEWAKEAAENLLDLARNEILKSLPKWKKATEHKEFPLHLCVMDENMYPFLDTEVNEGDYYIELSDLKTLPKEE